MKKVLSLLLAVLLAAVLAGCGGGTKKDLIESQFTALEDLSLRGQAAIAQINGSAAGSDNMVSAGFGEHAGRVTSLYDSFSDSVDGVKKLDDEERDTLLSHLEDAVAEAKPVVENLEAIAPEVETLSANAKALQADLKDIIPKVEAGALDAQQQLTYTEVATAYQNLEGQLNGILSQAEGAGLDVALEALRQANQALSPLCEKASALKTSLQAPQ